jgi:FtsZ-binding cell division protein ZapB
MDARGKMSEYGSLEKKVIELAENEKRLLMELEEVKNERDRRVQDYQRQLDKDKEAYRQKLNEYEQKAKESESRRASLMFEYEKERAKWQLEKENLFSIKADLTEQVEKLQVRKDQLLRENEKLRTENKGSRKYLFGNATNIPPSGQVSQSNIGMSSIGQSHHSSTSATRYMVGKSMSNVIGNNILT